MRDRYLKQFVEMSFEKAYISLEYLYNHATRHTAELPKVSKMPEVYSTFYLNLKWIIQPGMIKRKLEVADPGLSVTMMKISLPKRPQEPLEINHANNSRGSKIKKR